MTPALCPGRKNGRPSKFTPELARRVLKGIRLGMPLTVIADGVGVSTMSLRSYRQKNAKFDAAVLAASARGIEKRLKQIERASDTGDWRAASWLLEHCHPEHFARNRIEVTGDGLVNQIAVLVWPHQQNGNEEKILDATHHRLAETSSHPG